MYCQMIRVISSPSSSTTGLDTLIFAMIGKASWERRLGRAKGNIRRLLALPNGGRKPRDYALLAHPASEHGQRAAALRPRWTWGSGEIQNPNLTPLFRLRILSGQANEARPAGAQRASA